MVVSGTNYKSYIQNHGGRVLLLFLLFLLALYEFYSMGITGLALVCSIPAVILIIILAFRFRMLLFWALCIVNYFIQMKDITLPIPTSAPNEMLEIVLLILALIEVNELKMERTGNIMLYVLLIWCGFCTLEVLNDTCDLGINIGAWYTGARMMAFQLLYAFMVYILYITDPKKLINYLFIWGALSLFACFWVWKQKNIGFTAAESSWIWGRGRATHILQGGSLVRYYSIYSDAASFGIGIASTSVAFLIFALTSKIKRHKIFFAIVGFACLWAMFPSGTRTAIFCFFAGVMAYIVLSKNVKIAVSVTVLFAIFVFILAFTNIGEGNQQIRRMRSAFDRNDASTAVRSINQQTMRKYMKEAPWGIGLGMGYENVPTNNKYWKMATIAPDSEYIFIWLRTGAIGITLFLITTAVMLIGACCVVFFTLKSPSLRGVGAGLCCGFVALQLGGYGNQVLMQFPNCLIFYGGLALVYALPYFEDEWVQYEEQLFAEQEERKRLKLEKKKASRV